MQRYIEQLIEDLHAIAHKANASGKTEEEPVHDKESFLKHIEDVENYLHLLLNGSFLYFVKPNIVIIPSFSSIL